MSTRKMKYGAGKFKCTREKPNAALKSQIHAGQMDCSPHKAKSTPQCLNAAPEKSFSPLFFSHQAIFNRICKVHQDYSRCPSIFSKTSLAEIVLISPRSYASILLSASIAHIPSMLLDAEESGHIISLSIWRSLSSAI